MLTELPAELQQHIISLLSIKNRMPLRLVSKMLHANTLDILKIKTGATSYQDFNDRFLKLSKDLQLAVLNDEYTLTVAEVLNSTVLPSLLKLGYLLSEDEGTDTESENEEITGDRALRFNKQFNLWLLANTPNEYGIKYREEHEPVTHHWLGLLYLRITMTQIAKVLPAEQMKLIANYCSSRTLTDLTFLCVPLGSKNGMIALIKKLISLEQVIKLQHYLEPLFSDNGIIALRNNFITANQIERLPADNHSDSFMFLCRLLEDTSIEMMELGLIRLYNIDRLIDSYEPIIGLKSILEGFPYSKIYELLQKSKSIALDSQEAYAFIRTHILKYANKTNPLPQTIGFFAADTASDKTKAFIRSLLTKNPDAISDKETCEKFIAELKRFFFQEELYIDENERFDDALHAFFIIAKKLVNIDFYSLEVKTALLEAPSLAPGFI